MTTITLEARTVEVSASDYKKVSVQIELDERELNIQDIAEHISIDTFVEACGEDTLREYCERNFDWFDKKDES